MQYIHRVIKHFWNRWRKDYVLALRDNLRYKKNSCVKIPAVNDVVLIHDDKQPRQQWNQGKITELFQGMNGQSRTAKIKLGKSRNNIRRPINRLYPIEIQINDDTDMSNTDMNISNKGSDTMIDNESSQVESNRCHDRENLRLLYSEL